MKEFKIDKDIPLPVSKGKYDFLMKMELFDSVDLGLWDDKESEKIANTLYHTIRGYCKKPKHVLYKRKFTIKKYNDRRRIWRIK